MKQKIILECESQKIKTGMIKFEMQEKNPGSSKQNEKKFLKAREKNPRIIKQVKKS